jgi:Protein of unknown function DUF262/Protein of unknown function (DUF1524)
MSGINAHKTEFSTVLGPGRCYTIPIYQRHYAWKDDRNSHPLQDLWEDIRTTLQRKRDGQHYFHFFGPLVVISGSETNLFFLVDGQQRLTTILLLIKALRDHALELGVTGLVAEAEMFLLNGQPGMPDDRRLKLVPARVDRDELLGVLQLAPSNPHSGLIEDAHAWLSRQIRDSFITGWKPEEAERNLTDLLDVVTRRFQTVWIEIGGDEYAYEIFHSLNTKGTPLAESEKVKNLCFMKMRPLGDAALVDLHRNVWERMAAECARGDDGPARESVVLDRFLLVYLWIAWKGDFGPRQIYGEFKNYFETNRCPPVDGRRDTNLEPDAMRQLLVELSSEYAPAYAIIRHPALLVLPQEAPLRRAVERLRHLGCGDDADYLLLELGRCYLAWNRPVADAIRAVETLTSYFIWRRLCGISTKQHNRIFSQVGKELRRARLAGNVREMGSFADLLARQLIDLPATDDRWPDTQSDLRQKLILGGQYRQRAADFIKHILWYLERGSMTDEPPGALSIEHIFPDPTTPAPDGWRQELNDDELRLMEQRANGLPNLTLLESNEPALQNEAGNRPFSRKRDVYARSQFQMTRNLCAFQRWGPREIERRADELVRRICQLWPRPETGTGGAVS